MYWLEKFHQRKECKPHRFNYLKWLDRALEQCCRKWFSTDNSEALPYLTAGVSAWYPLNLYLLASLTATSEGSGRCDTWERPLGLEATKWQGNTFMSAKSLRSALRGCSVVLHEARPAFAGRPALASGNPASSFPNEHIMDICGMGEV